MIRFDERIWIFCAIFCLIFPVQWWISAIIAAGVHEFYHCAAIFLLRGRILGIRIGISGAEIETEGLTEMGEFLCALAGPLGSFSLLCVLRIFPVLSLCGLVQGCFNLLPVYPLDGGRAMVILFRRWFPQTCEMLFSTVQTIVFSACLAASLYGTVFLSFGWLPVILCVVGIANAWLRKKP